MYQMKMKGVKTSGNIDWKTLAKKSPLFSGSDIEGLCRDAALMPLKRLMRQKSLNEFEGGQAEQKLMETPITMEDFLDALKNTSASNSDEHLEQYQKWMDTFGST